MPLNGTREGLFLAPFVVTPESKAGARPVILLPNPFYQCYAAAILACGAEPVFVPATGDGFLRTMPRFRSASWREPSPPILLALQSGRGCGRRSLLANMFALADAYEFTVFADECYADIYSDKPPLGALTVRTTSKL